MSNDLFEIVANYTYDWESWFLPDGCVRWINPGVERMTGYSVDECLAMADYPLGIFHPEDREGVKSLLRSALKGTSGNDVEFRAPGIVLELSPSVILAVLLIAASIPLILPRF